MTATERLIDAARRIARDAPARQGTNVHRAGIQWTLIRELRSALIELDEEEQ